MHQANLNLTRLWVPLVLLMIAIFSNSVKAQSTNTDSVSDVFAFLPNIVIDTRRDVIFNIADQGRMDLFNCTSANFTCLSSRVFSISWPRKCGDFMSMAEWQMDQMRFIVLDRFVRRNHLSESENLIVFNPQNIRYIFLIDRQGLNSIIFARSPNIDLANLARSGVLREALIGRARFPDGIEVNRLTSMVPLGRCSP